MLNIFNQAQKNKAVIEKNPHDEAYVRITNKLLEKRKSIDDALSDQNLSDEAREDQAMKLIQIQKDLALFGISEIDYQAYKESAKDHQLSLF